MGSHSAWHSWAVSRTLFLGITSWDYQHALAATTLDVHTHTRARAPMSSKGIYLLNGQTLVSSAFTGHVTRCCPMSPSHAMVQPSYGRPWQLGLDTRSQQRFGQGSHYTVQQEFLQGLYFLVLPIPTLARVGLSLGCPGAHVDAHMHTHARTPVRAGPSGKSALQEHPVCLLRAQRCRGLGRGFMYQGAEAEPEDSTSCCKHVARWLVGCPLVRGFPCSPKTRRCFSGPEEGASSTGAAGACVMSLYQGEAVQAPGRILLYSFEALSDWLDKLRSPSSQPASGNPAASVLGCTEV